MAKGHVLVVDDEPDILELIRYNLDREGYEVTTCETGEAGLDRLTNGGGCDVVLLDLMLPGIDGLDVLRSIRAGSDRQDLPVILVSARGEEADVVTGLELGADDYITKPFSPRVMAARVKSVLRRRDTAVPAEETSLHVGELVIHPGRHEVLVEGKPVELTSAEFRLLHALARRPGWVFTRYQIVDMVHGANHPVTERSVDVMVMGLRRKLGSQGDLIETVRGVGYRFQDRS